MLELYRLWSEHRIISFIAFSDFLIRLYGPSDKRRLGRRCFSASCSIAEVEKSERSQISLFGSNL